MQEQRALALWKFLWSGRLIKFWWWGWCWCWLGVGFNYLSELPSVWSEGLAVCSSWRDKHSSPSLPQFIRCSSHWDHFTQSHVVWNGMELWNGNKTNHPVCSLSSMWGRCIDLRALLLHCAKQRRTHYTIPLGAILIQLSLKRTVCLKGLVPVTCIIHYHTENKATWFPLSSQCPSNVALWCKQWWHALLC